MLRARFVTAVACILAAAMAPIGTAKEHDHDLVVQREAGDIPLVGLYEDDDEAAIIESDTRLLKEEYYELTGEELTDRDIDDALSKAMREQLPKILKSGNLTFAPARDSETDAQSRREERRRMQERGHRRVQSNIPTNRKYIYVSVLSGGYDFNYGRNEFYCLAIRKLRGGRFNELRLRRGERFTFKECNSVRIEEIVTSYDNGKKIVMNEIGGPIGPWCMYVKSVASGQQLRVDHCDTSANNFKWKLLGGSSSQGGYVMKPDEDETLCVTAKPKRSGKKGGGKAILQQCVAPNTKGRLEQMMISCPISGNCKADLKISANPQATYLNCDINVRCPIQT